MSNVKTYYLFQLDFQILESVPRYWRQGVNPRHQAPEGQSVAKNKCKSKKTLFVVGKL